MSDVTVVSVGVYPKRKAEGVGSNTFLKKKEKEGLKPKTLS